ncbi:MAG TPA: Ig-like domain-containing protein [Burkholderiales bacterium]
MVRFTKTQFAVAALAVCGALPLEAQAQSTLPAPTSGELEIWFKAPLDGATVKGRLELASCYVKGRGVSRVEFFLDGATIGADGNVGDGMSCVLDTTRFANGAHKLMAIAFSSSGETYREIIDINIDNPLPSGATPPPESGELEAWFKAPLDGATVSGVLAGGESCYVKGRSVSRVQFLLDDTVLNTDTTMADGMQCVLDTTRFANGPHKLTAMAYDSSGASYREVIDINIANSAPSEEVEAWFKAPLANATVSGVLNGGESCYVRGTHVARVEFFLDGTAIGTDANVGDGMTCVLDTTKFDNGTHTLVAMAYSAGGDSYREQIPITIANSEPVPSTPAPTPGPIEAWFKAPLNGATVSGVLNGGESCYVKGYGVARVQFFLDGTALNSDTTMADGMQCVLDSTRFSDGAHQLIAMAYDADGKSYREVIDINIRNASGGDEPPPTSSLPSTGTRAVPTFESLGLYWKPDSNPGSQGCRVQYRAAGQGAWKQGLNLWYDARNAECRGSLVHLKPGTSYEVQFALPGKSWSRGLVAKTWSEAYPVARTVYVDSRSSQLDITEGGSPGGYVLYTPRPGTQATLDARNGADYNVHISAPYVIVRGFIMKGARRDAIRLSPGAHDVVIENNDISGWGRSRSGSLGVDMDSAVRAVCSSSWRLERVVVQNNRIHHPRYGSNSWDSGHPEGPQAVSFWECGGQHVIRYNAIYSSGGHYYNDAIGAGENFSARGFPYADTDIYGNRISHVYDDAIEAEGANRNVRVWGNFLDDAFVAVASTATHVGPFYVFRNVYNRGRTFGKAGHKLGYGHGRRYFFHNTLLQPSDGSGANNGIRGYTLEPMDNTVSRNNVWHVGSARDVAIGVISGDQNDFDYDLSNGSMTPYSGAERHGVVGVPVYASGHGSGASGLYQLAPGSRGYDAGVRLPNFNDAFLGAAPDMGAHEGGSSPMKFGPR